MTCNCGAEAIAGPLACQVCIDAKTIKSSNNKGMGMTQTTDDCQNCEALKRRVYAWQKYARALEIALQQAKSVLAAQGPTLKRARKMLEQAEEQEES